MARRPAPLLSTTNRDIPLPGDELVVDLKVVATTKMAVVNHWLERQLL